MDLDASRRLVRDGSRVIYTAETDGSARLAWAEPDELVTIDIRREELAAIRVMAFAGDPFRQLRDDWSSWLREPAQVPGALVDRGRRMIARSRALLADLRAGAGWLPLDRDHLLFDGTVGTLRLIGDRLRPCDWFHDELYRALWRTPELALVSPPADALAIATTFLTAVRAKLAELATGAYGYAKGTSLFLDVGGRVLSVRLDEHGHIAATTLFNPFTAVVPRAVLVEQLADALDRPLTPISSTVRDDLPALAAALARTRAQIIDDYIARIRTGMTISGGPTTDQSWTVSSDGVSFTIASYAPVGDGYERRCEPLAESELRRMLATYRMFGLDELPA